MPFNNTGGNTPIDKINVFDDTNAGRNNQPGILDLTTAQILRFQTIPLTLDMGGESTFSDIKISGRNNPIYHFTGSEDEISFEITWYSNHTSNEDVIRKCTWLRSLTKGDGYNGKPHEVKLIWGDLFKQSRWIVTAANFKLGLFQRDKGMLPAHAVQSITLKRITTINSSFSDNQKFNY